MCPMGGVVVDPECPWLPWEVDIVFMDRRPLKIPYSYPQNIAFFSEYLLPCLDRNKPLVSSTWHDG